MPPLSDIRYSRRAAVSAVRDYYAFLTKMYLKESSIIHPPRGGWPSITSNSLRPLGKSQKVVSLLRHLPYIGEPDNQNDKAEGAPGCYFADWQYHASALPQEHMDGEHLKMITEGIDIMDNVPPQVIGLTNGGGKENVYLLDTALGIVHWVDCPGEVKHDPSREPVDDDPYDYVEDEGEAEWRGDAEPWAIADFFELLKDQYRQLRFVPISSHTVFDVDTRFPENCDGMIEMIQRIYREHGWPDLELYRKDECLAAIQAAMKERYPSRAEWREDE